MEILGFFIDEAWLLVTSAKLVALFAATYLALKLFPKFPYWFDDSIDRVVKMDFKKKHKEEASKVIKWSVLIASAYFFFVFLGVQQITSNVYFRIIVLFFLMKIALCVIQPSVKKIDQKVSALKSSDQSHEMIGNLINYAVYVIAFIIALSLLGYTAVFTAALASAGIMGIVIGFAAKDVVSNTLAGVSIAFDKPLNYGEVVEIGGNVGIVEDIGLRMLKLKTFDNKVIMVPNSLVASGIVINYTRKQTRRIEIKMPVAYESDLKKAMSIMHKAPLNVKGVVLENPKKPIQVFLSGFGSSSLDLVLRFWLDLKKGSLVEAESEAKRIIHDDFFNQGIEIPYPRQVFISGDKPKMLKKRKK